MYIHVLPSLCLDHYSFFILLPKTPPSNTCCPPQPKNEVIDRSRHWGLFCRHRSSMYKQRSLPFHNSLWTQEMCSLTTTQVYEHCTHYIPRSDSDPYIKCSNTNQCIDACKARTGKCEKHYQNGEVAVSCAKLIGNMNEYCVAFETTCKTRFGSASE